MGFTLRPHKVETKVTAILTIVSLSSILEPEETELLVDYYENKITKNGYIQTSCQTSRSQLKNKLEAIDKLVKMVQRGIKPKKERKKRKLTKKSNQNRLNDKKHNSKKKASRKIWPSFV